MQEHIHHTDRKTQRGMTLVEIIAALAIIAAVIVGALALFGNASATQRATQFYSDVQALRTAANQLYMGTGSYFGLNDAALIGARKVPPTLAVNAGVINTIFNGIVTIAPVAGNAQFTIRANSIPEEACQQLLLSTNSTWASVQVTGRAIINNANFPITPAVASGAASGCAAGFNEITWTSVN